MILLTYRERQEQCGTL